MNIVTIGNDEIQDLIPIFGGDVDIRMLYARKGVPMKGFFYPELDDNYEYVIRKDRLIMNTVISWEKK